MSLEIYLGEYLAVLLIIAVILYTTNEVIRLVDSVRIMIVTRRVRQITENRSRKTSIDPGNTSKDKIEVVPEKTVWKAKPRQDTREWNAPKIHLPKINFNWLAVAAGVGVFIVFGLVYYIFGVYDPSGGR